MRLRRLHVTALLTAGTVVLAGVGVLGLVVGSVPIPAGDALHYLWAEVSGGRIAASELPGYRIVVESRLPRVLTAMLVGAGLSVVGVVVQAIVRNALADPYVLGISSGASVGATAVVLFGALSGLGVYALPSAAFLGALVATVVVFALARTPSGLEPLRLVLTGTALGYGFSAVTTVLVFLAPAGDAARNVMFWLLGSLAAATWQSVWLVGVVVSIATVLALCTARHLNALSMGDDVSASVGIDAGRFRLLLFAGTAVVVGVIVSVCGAIGFVGLIMPHVTRLLVGADHRRVLLVCPVLGAVFVVVADTLSRTTVPPYELPIGAITAAVGVPAFVLLMRRRRRVMAP
ncbi:FecCD family ABC transporter permease [Williamsia sterculiae]|uniref:Iron complex transport system permease protein n=1 Tax=Williamsia sterculiae TaxID=1344003 RepID=A0A1N7H1M5_9NOCA|nr:iron ABC transporter permease [Williamsia sterculiae]SIS18757.1 iron complex transport system permease protein [Williamsia sterculiae]